MKFLVKFVCLVFWGGSSAFAGTQLHNDTIYEISLGWGGEAVYVTINESIEPVEGCSGSLFKMPPGTPLFKENLSMLLSAFHARSKVSLYVDGCLGANMHLKVVAVRQG